MSLHSEPVDPKFMQTAVTAYIKDWARRMSEAGKTTTEIAHSVGLKSHASVSQWLAPGSLSKISVDVQRHVALLEFSGSMDRMNEEAVRWYEAQPKEDLPPAYNQAIGYLKALHKRDFSQAAMLHFRDVRNHKAASMAMETLVEQIYEQAQGEKGKSAGVRELGDDSEGR